MQEEDDPTNLPFPRVTLDFTVRSVIHLTIFQTGPLPGVVPDAKHSIVLRQVNVNGALCCRNCVCDDDDDDDDDIPER